MKPEGLQQVQKNPPLVLSSATRIQSTGSHTIFYQINLNIILPSALMYTKLSLFSTIFLQKPSMCLSSTQARHLLYISHPPLYFHAYNMWPKLKLWDEFRNVLIPPVASSLCRRHWRHRHAYRILRQIVAKRLVNPHSKSWNIILHSILTAHLNIISKYSNLHDNSTECSAPHVRTKQKGPSNLQFPTAESNFRIK